MNLLHVGQRGKESKRSDTLSIWEVWWAALHCSALLPVCLDSSRSPPLAPISLHRLIWVVGMLDVPFLNMGEHSCSLLWLKHTASSHVSKSNSIYTPKWALKMPAEPSPWVSKTRPVCNAFIGHSMILRPVPCPPTRFSPCQLDNWVNTPTSAAGLWELRNWSYSCEHSQ